MINYRSLKKLLGETSLERKCRLLFGSALMILITTSFWIYAGRTRQLVETQQVVRARTVIPQILWRRHLSQFTQQQSAVAEVPPSLPSVPQTAADPEVAVSPSADALTDVTEPAAPGSETASPQSFEAMNFADFRDRLEDVKELGLGVQWSLISADESPSDEQTYEALLKFRDGSDEEWRMEDTAEGERFLKYFAAIRATESCLQCHNGRLAALYENKSLVAVASVTASMESLVGQLSRNRAILLASAIVTTFLAMVVAYLIVRYIIVKPVLHLKDVSDEIARGNLNLRADINTGDEFEELSHAFNRMLRHMTTVNDELRGLNDSLDAKVDELAQANMELFNSNALKDEFLATMSHELRTPLNSILGFSDVLANAANLDDRQKRYVDNIRTSGRSLMVQINDLLDLAKIESGQMKILPTPVNLKDLVESQVGQIMPLADQKNIDLRVRQFDEAPADIHQDGGKIRQILTNLLSNAVKFTPEGGRVRVTFRTDSPQTFEISVEDTGIGIPLHEQDQIFEKFRQGTGGQGARDHVKREYGGTGLGLSIVRELSRLLGGDVHLESEFGKGSMFTVRLPLRVPTEQSEEPRRLDSPSGVNLNQITSVDLMNKGT